MVSPLVGSVVLAVYAAMLALGGLVGFLKAGSRPSLIAGLVSGAIAAGAAWDGHDHRRGLIVGAALAAAMVVVFAIRFGKTRKVMPSGMLAVVSLVVLAVEALACLPG